MTGNAVTKQASPLQIINAFTLANIATILVIEIIITEWFSLSNKASKVDTRHVCVTVLAVISSLQYGK